MREARFPRLLLALSVVGLILVGVGGAPSPAAAQGKRKLAMILPGPIQDADFNAVGYVALQELAKAYDLQVSHSESVAVADAERVSREYITSGYDIIAYHGGQFPTSRKELSAQCPNVVFIQEGSGRMADAPANAWVIGRKFYQGLDVLGALGALSTKTGKVGFVGGVRLPDLVATANALQQAIRDHNPQASLIYNFIGDFNDPVKARQTAEAQIAAGADVLVTFVNLGIYGVAGVAKRFGDTVALRSVDFAAARGEIHGLLGENGAGKTTLMNILSGLYRADRGQILIEGAPTAIRSPEDALRYRIGMVHQHVELIVSFTALETVLLWRAGSRPWLWT